jgi:serine protease
MENANLTKYSCWGVALATLLAAAAPATGSAEDARYIVKFNRGRGAQGQAALRAAGARIVLNLGPQEAVAARMPAAALAGLARNPHISYIEADPVREPMALWSDVSLGGETLPFGIQMVQADLVDSPNAGNRKVCIIDSGYSPDQEDLKEAGVTAQASDAGSGTWNKDSCGHGTHVAGTVAAISGNGVGVVGANPGVSLHIVKVFGDDVLDSGACSWTYSSNLIAALNQCTAAGANVVSMSLGGSNRSRTEEAAFASADAAGVLSVAAAGNAGNRQTSFPAGYAAVLSVAAVDANEALAGFSQQNSDVELAAPGVSVLSTVPWLDANTLSVKRRTWSGGRMEGAPRTAGTGGDLADGGTCTAAGAWSGKVVLCQRGAISFADKVKNVQAGGGVAAAIYNNVTSDPTCGVFTGTLGSRPRTDIPAISLSCADGADALTHVGAASNVTSNVSYPGNGYEAWNGTSMATPHVSAVAALIWSCHPGASNAAIRGALTSTARDLGNAGRDIAFGYGLVQAKDALLALGDPGTCTVR